MSIEHAILGFLSWKPLTGYDCKKLFSETTFIPWSGNNNQIYRTLVSLHKRGYVTVEIDQPPSGPARKVYTISADGKAALKTWLLSTPSVPEGKNPFLIQLAWTEELETRHILDMLKEYTTEIQMRLHFLEETAERRSVYPARSDREKLIWDRISENEIMKLRGEKEWAQNLAADLESG